MTSFLRSLSPNEQVGLLFVVVFGMLTLASLGSLVWSIRERGDDAQAEARQLALRDFNGLLRTSWFMVAVFWIGWAAGERVATLLFAVVSFFVLREFITLSPTRRGDHRSLVLAFFVVLPVQYLLVVNERFDLFTVFIPVYVFLAIPVVSALANDPQRFLERNAKLQWGIMVCVYGMSHVPALLLLDFPRYGGKTAFLVFFLVFVVQTCMIVQHLASRRIVVPPEGASALLGAAQRSGWQRTPVAPNVSQSFNWASWGVGVLAGCLLGVLLSGITPFKPGQALGMSLIACVAGSMGHLVMKALKRDRGVTHWGSQGASTTGASGLLDRVDALCFAAPVFFHSVRWYFGL